MSSTCRLDHDLQLALYRAVCTLFYGNSTDPDPQLYHVILSCESAIVMVSS